jgi:hypothetical protein
MRISRIGPRLTILSLAFPLACAIAASGSAQTAPQGDIYSSVGGGNDSSSGEFRGIIVSITPNGINTVDVKLQDPVTHYIHSVTVMVDVIKDQGLTKGERVTQYKDPETGEPMLAPTMMSGSGQPLPGQAKDTGAGSNPPPGPGDNGSPPSYPPPNTNGPPTYTGGTSGSGSPPPYYPAPKMVGNLTGSGVVNGIPVTIGGSGPNTTPVPAGSSPGTPITASNQSGQGNWKLFSGSLMTDGLGYYVQFNQGYFQGYFNGQYRNGWFPITPQNVRLNAS